ncbi:EAL domain-containing protein [uncultured Sphaerotilus sp.]|uniref:EAL domain-containing protein n=1 Tax=uncultured Sphaerotilus sp. TaxID=474984 RepID=UPI0030CA1675
MPAPIPEDDTERLARLRALAILDSEAEPIFDTLTQLASRLCGTPIALLSLIDGDRQWFKSSVGMPGVTQTPLDASFCSHAIRNDAVMSVSDARIDPRFQNHPMVLGEPGFRLYAGAPLTLSDGHRVGTLCVVDRQPGQLDAHQLETLQQLAAVAVHAMEMRVRAIDALDALHDSREMLHVTLRSIADAVITTDAQGAVTWLNPVAERMTGWCNHDAQGRAIEDVFCIVHDETRQTAPNPVRASLHERCTTGLADHTVLISRDGSERGIEDSAAPICDANGTMHGVVLVFHDVTEQRRLSHEMNHRASHDALTGLVNRSEFDLRLHRVLARAQLDRSDNALLYIDLDQFKLVNDACGHAAGDQLLRQISHLLRSTVRTRDTLARLGGDEFGVLLEHCTTEQALRVAQQVCDQMDEFRFHHGERRFRIGASIGLVPVDARWVGATAVLQAADASCYAAKEAGRNRVHAWHDTDEALRERHGQMEWINRLEQALDEDRFELHGQRILPVGTAAAGLHCEVLLRLRESDGTLVLPGAFLPAAERFQMATRIDRWVLRRVFDELAEVDVMPDVIAVNLSGQSLGDRSFHRYVADLVAEARFDVTRLCFEVTETAAITHLGDAAVFMSEMRALGLHIALDDFGAGTSSFGYLKTLPVDVLKIDGQFICDLPHDALDLAAVRCFRDVARVVGVRTVAEFVETEAVLAQLGEIGIDFAQGYLVHRPEPLAGLLGARRPLALPA